MLYAFQLLGHPFQDNFLSEARVMVGLVMDGVKRGRECKAAGQFGEGLTREACRGCPLVLRKHCCQ